LPQFEKEPHPSLMRAWLRAAAISVRAEEAKLLVRDVEL
jgi:hypothetical protein